MQMYLNQYTNLLKIAYGKLNNPINTFFGYIIHKAYENVTNVVGKFIGQSLWKCI